MNHELKILCFDVGGVLYGIDISNVIEILTDREVDSMPNCAEYVEGIFMSRNIVIPVINLFKLVHLEQPAMDRNLYIVASYGDKTAAFHSGYIKGIITVDASKVKELPTFSTSTGLVKNIVQTDFEMILILDYERIIHGNSGNTEIEN